MQSIAKELGLSETAFVNGPNAENSHTIRYFSPKMEIPLCGHATLAASKVIFDNDKEISSIHFINNQNLDLVIKKENNEILMEFPAYDTTGTPLCSPRCSWN